MNLEEFNKKGYFSHLELKRKYAGMRQALRRGTDNLAEKNNF